MSWVYVYQSLTPGLWTVGFYRPDGTWVPESDHKSVKEASKRTAWLNGDASRTEAEAVA